MGTRHWRYTVDEFVVEPLVIPLTVIMLDELRERVMSRTWIEPNRR
jgi:hypothetical protein